MNNDDEKTDAPDVAHSAVETPEAMDAPDAVEEQPGLGLASLIAALDWDDYQRVGKAGRQIISLSTTHGETADGQIGESIVELVIAIFDILQTASGRPSDRSGG